MLYLSAAIVIIGLGLAMLVLFNRIVRARNEVDDAEAHIRTQLQRRHDLIPNLVNVVQAFAGHERQTLQKVIAARNEALSPHSDPKVSMAAECRLGNALVFMKVLAERYPQLAADRGFIDRQRELSEIETAIARSRQFYNDAILRFRNLVDSYPGRLLAGLAAVRPAPPYSFEKNGARAAPRVHFERRPG
jgi:LemA protein